MRHEHPGQQYYSPNAIAELQLLKARREAALAGAVIEELMQEAPGFPGQQAEAAAERSVVTHDLHGLTRPQGSDTDRSFGYVMYPLRPKK